MDSPARCRGIHNVLSQKVMSDSNITPAVVTETLNVAGLSVEIAAGTMKVIRTVTAEKSGQIRVSFVPASAKTGVSLKSLGYKGQAAKAVLRKAKREIGAAFVGAMATAVAAGKLDWKSATLSKTGTLGVYFSEGQAEDAAALAAAEEKADSLAAELEAMKAELAAMKAAKTLSESEKAELQAELAA